MNYISTRNRSALVTAAQAIAKGISEEGGLFVPDSFPSLDQAAFEQLCRLDYKGRAKAILSLFLNDFTKEEVDRCIEGAYTGTFENEQPAPLISVGKNTYLLELWHGPTCAFKDLALQLLPYLLVVSAEKTAGGNKTVILVATSGDTGKAALEGFRDVKDTEIIVFYPSEGVSAMQKLQMSSQQGENVHVFGIHGNFDDAQTAVKAIFTDGQTRELLAAHHMQFSSANSINWGRLAPQIVYYVSAYCDLLNSGELLENGFNVVVPTGNFGNILAAYYAKKIGVPIAKLVCASNANNVLTDFIRTGVYDRNRSFYTTASPSMDILISSNLERMLFELCGGDDKTVAALQAQLVETGRFTISDDMKAKMSDLFWGGFCDDTATLETIGKTFRENGYLCDTHTGVAVNVCEQYRKATGDTRPCVIASTASPYKFADRVLAAVGDTAKTADEFDKVRRLSELTHTAIPAPIAALENAHVRFEEVCEKAQMAQAVCRALKIQ